MKSCLYSSVQDKALFSRVGFYRNDLEALKLCSDKTLITNSVFELVRFRPDLIVAYFFTKSIMAAVCGRLMGARIIIGGGGDQFSPVLGSGFRLFVHRVLAVFCLLLAHRISLSCTDDLVNIKKLCFGFKFLEKKLHFDNHVVIPSPSTRLVENDRSAQFSAFTLCWMGSEGNVKRKGVDRAVRLISMLRTLDVDASLDIAGTDGTGRIYLEKLIQELDLVDHVRILGAISEDEKNTRLVEGGVYIQLSEHEGFGVAAAEAFFSGMIVVHSNKGGLRDVIGENGLIVDLAVIDNSDVVAVRDFYNQFLNYKINTEFLNNNLKNYSIQMRSEAFCGVV
jgi:glycosyltransferase involved in cell wall biosynthesis